MLMVSWEVGLHSHNDRRLTSLQGVSCPNQSVKVRHRGTERQRLLTSSVHSVRRVPDR